jgi:glycerol-3-phosphate acyltransferase PlsX
VSLTIALDVMGGDHGAKIVIPGAALSLVRHPDIRYLLVGDEGVIAPELGQHPKLAEASDILHTDVAIGMDAKPSQALRKGRWKSSMWLALEAVRSGRAAAVVSAGNTGALMAMAKFCLKTAPGIERPAIAALWPTVDSECIVLDVGANVEVEARQLVEFAVMGAAMARAVFGVERPTVGLLNIGVEEVKGLDETKRASSLLRTSNPPFEYRGFVEGDQVGQGVVDVVVTDGFTGNVALKTAEGTARQIGSYLRAAMNRSLFARMGAVLASGAFKALRRKMDPRQMNGGLLVGLNGIAIKSHGGTDAMGFASAIDLGYDLAQSRLVESIGRDIEKFNATLKLDSVA